MEWEDREEAKRSLRVKMDAGAGIVRGTVASLSRGSTCAGPGFCRVVSPTSFGADFSPVQKRPGFESPGRAKAIRSPPHPLLT